MEQEPQSTRETTPQKTSFIRELINFALIIIFVVLPIRMFVAQPFVVVGSSMEPTFIDGDYLIIDEISYRFNKPQRGEVVVFDYGNIPQQGEAPQEHTSKYFIKRIIGLPGETVEIKDGVVQITNAQNPEGFVLDEPYIAEPPLGTTKRTLGQDEYFVMGDHRGVSFDSRSWGPLPKQELTGRVFLRLFPFQELGVFPGNHTDKYIHEKN